CGRDPGRCGRVRVRGNAVQPLVDLGRDRRSSRGRGRRVATRHARLLRDIDARRAIGDRRVHAAQRGGHRGRRLVVPYAVADSDRSPRAVRIRARAATDLSEPAIEARGWGWRHPGRPAWRLRGPVPGMSDGEKQRVAIAGILALRPRVLLLDEPTANLDPDGARAVREVIARVAERGDVTMVMVEHRVADVLPLVDRVIAIEAGGGVVADGPAHAVFAREGERLKRLGVWVPGAAPAGPPRRAAADGEAIVARDLSYLY